MEQKYIYIVLVRAWTGLGFIARRVMSYEYSHIAVCLKEPLEDFITFSRRNHYTPWNCGFMHETMESYLFGKHESVKLKVFKVPVDDEKFENIVSYIDEVENDKSIKFNIFGMITMPILHGVYRKKKHNCMSFTGKILEISGSVKMEKPFYKYNIKEMDNMLTAAFGEGKEGYYESSNS